MYCISFGIFAMNSYVWKYYRFTYYSTDGDVLFTKTPPVRDSECGPKSSPLRASSYGIGGTLFREVSGEDTVDPNLPPSSPPRTPSGPTPNQNLVTSAGWLPIASLLRSRYGSKPIIPSSSWPVVHTHHRKFISSAASLRSEGLLSIALRWTKGLFRWDQLLCCNR